MSRPHRIPLVGRLAPAAALCLAALAILAGALSPAGPSAAASGEETVRVYFTRGEQLATVARPADGAPALDAALRALVAGPTVEERRRGFRSSIPAGTSLRGTSIEGDAVLVDLSSEFAVGPRESLQARLVQVVFTATQFRGLTKVRIAVDGVPLPQLGDLALLPPPGRADFLPAPYGGAPPPEPRVAPEPSPLVLAIQRRLVDLGYLPAGADDGVVGPQTRHGILAFQGWEVLPRDGRATRRLLAALREAERPRLRGAGRRIEIDLARQVALLVDGRRVFRTVHVSTGAAGTPTPLGSFRVYRREPRSWSVPFRVWLPYASYFNRGIAFHEYPDVPTYPASHGCVRVPASESRVVYAFAVIGTRVVVR
jgi:hypothetical protein